MVSLCLLSYPEIEGITITPAYASWVHNQLLSTEWLSPTYRYASTRTYSLRLAHPVPLYIS